MAVKLQASQSRLEINSLMTDIKGWHEYRDLLLSYKLSTNAVDRVISRFTLELIDVESTFNSLSGLADAMEAAEKVNPQS